MVVVTTAEATEDASTVTTPVLVAASEAEAETAAIKAGAFVELTPPIEGLAAAAVTTEAAMSAACSGAAADAAEAIVDATDVTVEPAGRAGELAEVSAVVAAEAYVGALAGVTTLATATS